MRPQIFEEHSSVLAHWWASGQRDACVIYLDAHLDLQPVDAAALQRLRACRSVDEIASLERPHPLCAGAPWVHGLEDWLVPAHRLGMIGQLIWVAPPHVGAGFNAQALAQLSQMDGVDADALSSFHRNADGCIQGALLGVPIILCSLAQLRQFSLPAQVLIDVDIDFFISVPGDRPWISPAEVFALLHALRPQPLAVTLSRSVGSGFTPLRYRFLADWLAALWGDQQETSLHLARLFDLAQDTRPAGTPDLMARAEQEANRHPGCAATCQLLGEMAADPAQAARWLSRAHQLDPTYGPDPLREACSYPNRRRPMFRTDVLALQQALAGLDIAEPRTAWAWAAVGLLHVALGGLDEAERCLERCGEIDRPNPKLALAIAEQRLRSGQLDEAERHLDLALSDAEERTAALMLLGHMRRLQSRWIDALRALDEAAHRAPAWIDVRRAQQAVCHQLGRLAEAERHGQGVRDLQSLSTETACRLA